MNRILFEADELLADGTVRLTDARAEHLRRVLRVEPGQTVASGTVNGLAGVSRVLAIGDAGVWLSPVHDAALPEPWLDLLLAVPRPRFRKQGGEEELCRRGGATPRLPHRRGLPRRVLLILPLRGTVRT